MLLLCLVGIGCTSAEQADRYKVDTQQKIYATAQPIPVFDWSIERDMAIQLYKTRMKSVRTWTVWRSDFGMIEGHCESIGFPLPYDVQLTNPLQPAHGGGPIEQAEPNGLFSSKHTTATWIRSVVKYDGKVLEVPLYVEGKVTCYPYPVIVDYDTNRVKPADSEMPSVVLEKSKK